MARSNVSTSLRELDRWGIVKVSHVLGDRRDHFESLQDTWKMIRLILEERKRREIDPTLPVLEACLEECETSDPVDPAGQGAPAQHARAVPHDPTPGTGT